MGNSHSPLQCCREPQSLAEGDEILGDCTKEHEELQRIVAQKPWLDKERHVLNQYVVACRQAIEAQNKVEAAASLENLTLEVDSEDHQLGAAFNQFDSSKDGALSGEEVKFMLDYLGFPCDADDIKELIAAVDTDSDNTVSFEEFLHYVGGIGGSEKLFEVRRRQIEDRIKSTGATGELPPDAIRNNLIAAGIDQSCQAYWKLTASPSELESAAKMQQCQRQAVRHIRNLAKESHERALSKLKLRVTTLGYTEVELYMALAWVRELAPIIVHIKLDKLGDIMAKDTHYRNQFETKSSGGLLKPAARIKWEKGLFGTAYNDAKHFDRPKYGVLNIWNDYRGVMGCAQYGDSYLVLKDVRLRCTLSPEDSANLKAHRLAVPDYYAHVLAECSDKELAETLRVTQGGDERVGDSKTVIEKWGKYKEVQIHGEVDFKKHVERIVIAERHRGKKKWAEGIAKVHGWKVTWMNDMKEELTSKADGQEMDKKEWQERLEQFKSETKGFQAAEAFCKAQEQPTVERTISDGQRVQWDFSVQSGWMPYESVCQDTIEKAYEQFKKSGSPNSVEIQSRKMKITIDFGKMQQTVKGNGRVRNVQRQHLPS